MLDYIICNRRGQYIRLNEKGTPVVCTRSQKDQFDYHKAKNILSSMPKALRQFNFEVKPYMQTDAKDQQKKNKTGKTGNSKILSQPEIHLCSQVEKWLKDFEQCGNTLSRAKKRNDELHTLLPKVDMEICDILHLIELEPSKDLYGGWKLYKKLKDARERRRAIKDEIVVVEAVIKKTNVEWTSEEIQRIGAGLKDRKYAFRILSRENL